MLFVSFLCGLSVLLLAQKLSVPKALLSAFAGALSGTAAELFSPGEYDTVTVPIAILTVLLIIL